MNARQRRKQRRIAARSEAFVAAILSHPRVWQMVCGRMDVDFAAAYAVTDPLPAPPPQLPPKWRGGGVSEEP